MPRVSVVLPTRNRAQLLRRAVGSVLAQTFADLELIVVDDASTDQTPQVLSELDEPRLRVVRRERNRGAAAARNAGLAHARGEFVAFQDDDDVWLIQKLEKQLRAVEDAHAHWSIGGLIRLEPSGPRYVGGRAYIERLDFRRGMGLGGAGWGLIATPGWLVRRSLLERVGAFDERILSYDDWELGLRLWQISKPVVVDEPLWLQDWVRGAGLTRAERARASDLRLIIEKHGALWQQDKQVLARHAYMIGRAESLYDPPPAGRSALWTAIRLRPWWPRAWYALLVSYLPPSTARAVTQWIRRMGAAAAR